MKKTKHIYLSRSAELAVITELVGRGYNASSSLVDEGEDIYAIHGSGQKVWPIQVKSAKAIEHESKGYSGTFMIDRTQLFETRDNEIVFVFAVRRKDAWENF